jgi:hypothetical protein
VTPVELADLVEGLSALLALAAGQVWADARRRHAVRADTQAMDRADMVVELGAGRRLVRSHRAVHISWWRRLRQRRYAAARRRLELTAGPASGPLVVTAGPEVLAEATT